MNQIEFQSYSFAGADYIVNTQDTQSTIFTVTFQSKQSLSSAYAIQIVDDQILEGREYFVLRISDVRYFGQLGLVLRTQEALTKTSILVSIEDDDSKSSTSACNVRCKGHDALLVHC